jgi:prophage regulatory protein
VKTAIKKLLDRTKVFDDSIEVAAMLSQCEGYPAAEARSHLCGLWAHTKELHRALARECNGDTAPKDKLIKLPEVRAKTTLSVSELYRRLEAGDFPKQVRMGPKSVAWIESEIDAWIDERIAAR